MNMESLIQKAKKKDPNAFTELMQSQMKNMYRTAVEADNSNLEWKEALAALDEKYRLVLVLFYSEGFHTKEIASMLKIPNSTVRTRLARGREQLAKYYGADLMTGKEKIV